MESQKKLFLIKITLKADTSNKFEHQNFINIYNSVDIIRGVSTHCPEIKGHTNCNTFMKCNKRGLGLKFCKLFHVIQFWLCPWNFNEAEL